MTTTSLLRGSAACLLLGYFLALFAPTLPEGAYSDSEVADLLQGSDRVLLVAGGYAMAVAGLAALVFTHLLASSLPVRRSTVPVVVRAAGTGYGVLLLLAAVAFTTVPMASAVGELPAALRVDAFRVTTQMGFYALLVPGLLCAAVMIGAASIALRGSGSAPAWVVSAGFVLVPLMLLGFAWLPQFLVPLWAVSVAFALRVEATGGPQARPGQASPVVAGGGTPPR